LDSSEVRRKNVGFLAQRVRALRKKKGLTQEQAAERGELTYKHFQAIEEGFKTDVRLSTLRKLAKAFDISVSRFLSGL
jgi:transcriptional regulator with XRE-family HTH domain